MISVVKPGRNGAARSERLGEGVGALSVVCAAAAYLIQLQRTKR